MKYLVPVLFILLFVYALFKHISPYESFVKASKNVPPLLLSLFPYLTVMFLLTEICQASGLTDKLCSLLAPMLSKVGVPSEILPLLLLKPFSGSGATALLSELLTTYGADSRIGLCACVCYGSSETIFYIASVYFAGLNVKTGKTILFLLIISLLTTLFGCLMVSLFFA